MNPVLNFEELAKKVCTANSLTLIGAVGTGSFKQTFRVKNGNGQDLALKIFSENNEKERQQREIEAMQKCNHAHIAKLHHLDTFNDAGKNYMWLLEEFIDGGSLREKFKSKSPVEYYPFAAQMVSAIEHVYSHNLVHRDFKPDNVMMRSTGEAVLVDFGIVRDLKSESVTPTWAAGGPGTPSYASPEQFNNEKALIDWRSDQFSLGIVLSLMLLGIHPFEHPGDNLGKIILRISLKENPSAEFIKRASEAGHEYLIKMVSPWPVGRYRTPKDLMAAIEGSKR